MGDTVLLRKPIGRAWSDYCIWEPGNKVSHRKVSLMFTVYRVPTVQVQKRKNYNRYLCRILNKLDSANPTENLLSLLSRDTYTYLETARAAVTVN